MVAQKHPVFYGGIEYYRHTHFEGDAYFNFNAGAQVYRWKFFAPEVGFDLYMGSPSNIKVSNPVDPNYSEVAYLSRTMTVPLLTLAPKFKFGRDDAFITITPKYHIGEAAAKANYYELSSSGKEYHLEESQKVKKSVSFWSFAVGIEGFAIEAEKYWFSLSLNLTFLDVEEAFQDLDFSKYDIDAKIWNTTTLGFGIRFNWDPFVK